MIRKHALGKFSAMLRASAAHPAMMMYLNNAESSRDNPNENYGREILELHSIGVDGGYDEDDMRQSTMILTGFGISWDAGEFQYHPWDHFVGQVDVMGFHRANRSENKGKDRPDPDGVDGQQGLYWMTEGLGHLPMGWVPPDGFPDTGDPWRSAGLTLGRWNMHVGLAAGWWPAKPPQGAQPEEERAAQAAAGDGRPRERAGETAGVPQAAGGPPRRGARLPRARAGDPLDADDAAVDWRLPYLVALILDTPSHGIR